VIKKVAMVILAGGFSQRMGVLKPLLPVGVEPAVIRCVELANAVGICNIVVVTGYRDEDILKVLVTKAPDVRVVHNECYSEGMFSSVLTGVSALSDGIDGFFLLPADCCAVSSDTFSVLIEAFNNAGKSVVIRPKMGEGSRGHPPLIPMKYADDILSYNGEDGLKGVLRNFPTVEVNSDDIGVNLDMDTPEDYAVLLEHLGLPTCPSKSRCMEIFAKLNTPEEIIIHGEQVAKLALGIAEMMMDRGGEKLNLELLESASLLHDIKRMEVDHAKRGMELVLKKGYPKTAILIGRHMDLGCVVTDVKEQEILYVADKLCRNGRIVSLEETRKMLEKKFESNSDALKSANKRIDDASVILSNLKQMYGVTKLPSI